MASKYQLVINNGNLMGTTGHHEINCHVEETLDDGTVVKGIPEVYGCESIALERRHGGKIEAWREWVAGEMLAKHKRRMLAHAEIMGWSGQRFDIPE